MELKPEQIEKFRQLHSDIPGSEERYSEEQVVQIANGVANYYLTLFNIHKRISKDRKAPITLEDIPDG
jgi:hypothetical protein